MRSKTLLIFLLVLLLAVPTTHIMGFDAPSTPIDGLQFGLIGESEIDFDRSFTIIEAKVENHGFETVYVWLPPDWEVDPQVLGAQGEPIIERIGPLRQKYGDPGNRFSFISNYFVFWTRSGFPVSRGPPFIFEMEDGGESVGWSIRPNERLVFRVQLKPSDEEAIIDPLSLEMNRSDIKVVEWNQEMKIYKESDAPMGFIVAPWIVKNATLVEAFPAPISNLSAFGDELTNEDLYWNLFRFEDKSTEKETEVKEIDSPAWDEWFSSGSGLFGLTPTRLVPLKTNTIEIPQINKTQETEELQDDESLFIPVWLWDFDEVFIRYRYEWKRGVAISGVETDRFTKPYRTLTELFTDTPVIINEGEEDPDTVDTPPLDLTTLPEWYSWF